MTPEDFEIALVAFGMGCFISFAAELLVRLVRGK